MKRIFFIIAAISFFLFTNGQENSPVAIKAQMAKIRQNTNWENPEAAKKANQQIESLSLQLIKANQRQKNSANSNQNVEENNQNSPDIDEVTQENNEYNAGVWNDMTSVITSDDDSKYDLANALKKEIAEDYEEDESPKVVSNDYFQESNLLCIDMSSSSVQTIINQMENYKSIKILIITGGEKATSVNLYNLLQKAAGYPLEQLHIIHFKNFVKSLPMNISHFKNLRILSVFDNSIEILPNNLGFLKNLQELYLDINPITSIKQIITPMNELKKLGIAKTQISQTEVQAIKEQLPACKILEQ